jgi:transcriptional regulator with XRE-family HTH domain
MSDLTDKMDFMIADRPRDWANIVRDRRMELGLSQAELAQRIGLSRQWVVRFENGAGTDVAQLTTVLDVVAALRLDPELNKPAGDA